MRSPKQRHLGQVGLFALLFLSSWLLTIKVVRLRVDIRNMAVDLANRQADLNIARAERRAYLDLLQSMQLNGDFLSGVQAGDRKYVQYDQAIDGLYYVIDTQCGACANNVPMLNRLADDKGVHIIGLSLTNNADELTKWASRVNVESSLLSSPVGKFTAMLPRIGTPITIAVRNGRVLAIYIWTTLRYYCHRPLRIRYAVGLINVCLE